jgi:hypothetical protein
MQGDIWETFLMNKIVSYEAGNTVCKYSMLIEGRNEFTYI